MTKRILVARGVGTTAMRNAVELGELEEESRPYIWNRPHGGPSDERTKSRDTETVTSP